MRRLSFVLAVVLLSLVSARAEEEPIPIRLVPLHGIDVTPAQLSWVRTWLKEHLCPSDLAALEVDVDNRTHPTSLVCAEARLPPKVSGTHHVQRVIRIQHESWDTFGDAYGFKEAETSGPWRVLDTYRVQRVFPLGATQKILGLDDTVSYTDVHAVLQAIQARALRVLPAAEGNKLPQLERITWIHRDKGGLKIMMTDPEDELQGWWCKGVMEDGTFVIHEGGPWIA